MKTSTKTFAIADTAANADYLTNTYEPLGETMTLSVGPYPPAPPIAAAALPPGTQTPPATAADGPHTVCTEPAAPAHPPGRSEPGHRQVPGRQRGVV